MKWVIMGVVAVILIGILIFSGIFTGNAIAQSSYQCNDRYDNDGDGFCDYRGSLWGCKDGSRKGDTGCSSTTDKTEAICVAGSTYCGIGECRRTSTCVRDVVTCTPGTPGTEICDGKDNDCDGSIDEGLGSTTCGVGACQRTVQNCVSGIPQTCTPGTPGTEICGNGIDEDCNGADLACTNYTNTCTDSDGGLVYTTMGTVSGLLNGTAYSNTDSCMNTTTLKEYYCSGTRAYNTLFNCSAGCSSGKCNAVINQTNNTCTDSDGGIVTNIKGTVSGYENNKPYSYTDTCLDSTYVKEYYCSFSKPTYNEYSCVGSGGNSTGNSTTSCLNGACI